MLLEEWKKQVLLPQVDLVHLGELLERLDPAEPEVVGLVIACLAVSGALTAVQPDTIGRWKRACTSASSIGMVLSP